MPAQWQKYPLSTQQEMMAGRRSVSMGQLQEIADEGERYLHQQFPPGTTRLEFKTVVVPPDPNADYKKGHVLLGVYKYKDTSQHADKILEIKEKIEEFVTTATLAKIILVSG